MTVEFHYGFVPVEAFLPQDGFRLVVWATF
jgi:hypothetical protein